MVFLEDIFKSIATFFKINIVDAVCKIGIKDIVDIFFLACAFFFFYRFARKRRATKLIMGVVLFFVLVSAAHAMDLVALGFVFGDFKQLGVIALLIIFQPELRSALEKIGGMRVFNFHSGHIDKEGVNAHYVVESVSRAAQKLSSAGHGALIVIERKNSLDEYKRTGTAIDAIISPDMLCSIFYKGTALHDGAVIIKNGRIDAAACVMPLTTRVDIDSELGTRHRAAIGTTEISDAIVVVVSEETGNISLSMDGELARGFTYFSLREALEKILVPRPHTHSKKKLPRSIRAGKKNK